MGAEIEQEAHVGEFTCDLEVLGRILGLPETGAIHHIEMTPMAILGVPSVRIVVEDPANLPPIKMGQEVSRISPRYILRDKTFRQFGGWKIEGVLTQKNADRNSVSESDQPTNESS